MATLKDITICIPTINRSHYLKRALAYYSKVKFPGKILIGDESDDEHKKINRSTIEKCKSLDISYIHLPHTNKSNDAKMLYALSFFVETPYVTFTGDDDFLVPSGAEQCINFLEENKDFAAAHGGRLNFILNNKQLVHLDKDEGYEWINENAWERWLSYMHTGVATVSFIHRTENWKKQYAYTEKINCRYIGTELIICSVAAIQGKVKRLENLSVVFQRETPNRLFSFRNHTLWDLMNSDEWATSANLFVQEINKLLEEQGFKKEDEIKQEFWYHCLNILVHQFNNKDKEVILPTEPIILDINKKDSFYPIYKLITGNK